MATPGSASEGCEPILTRHPRARAAFHNAGRPWPAGAIGYYLAVAAPTPAPIKPPATAPVASPVSAAPVANAKAAADGGIALLRRAGCKRNEQSKGKNSLFHVTISV